MWRIPLPPTIPLRWLVCRSLKLLRMRISSMNWIKIPTLCSSAATPVPVWSTFWRLERFASWRTLTVLGALQAQWPRTGLIRWMILSIFSKFEDVCNISYVCSNSMFIHIILSIARLQADNRKEEWRSFFVSQMALEFLSKKKWNPSNIKVYYSMLFWSLESWASLATRTGSGEGETKDWRAQTSAGRGKTTSRITSSSRWSISGRWSRMYSHICMIGRRSDAWIGFMKCLFAIRKRSKMII